MLMSAYQLSIMWAFEKGKDIRTFPILSLMLAAIVPQMRLTSPSSSVPACIPKLNMKKLDEIFVKHQIGVQT
jgi:hypothetical protein